MDGDVVELGALLDVLEVGLGGRQGELVLVHVGDVPQDVVPPPLGDHLTGSQTQRGGENVNLSRFFKLCLFGHTQQLALLWTILAHYQHGF